MIKQSKKRAQATVGLLISRWTDCQFIGLILKLKFLFRVQCLKSYIAPIKLVFKKSQTVVD